MMKHEKVVVSVLLFLAVLLCRSAILPVSTASPAPAASRLCVTREAGGVSFRLCDLPAAHGGYAALLVDLPLTEEGLVPYLTLHPEAAAAGWVLTIGRPMGGWVRVMADGPTAGGASIGVMRMAAMGEEAVMPALAGGGLWVTDGSGQAQRYPLSVEGDLPIETDSAPAAEFEGESRPAGGDVSETQVEGESERMDTETERETEVAALSPVDTDPEDTDPQDPDPADPDEVGCLEYRQQTEEDGSLSLRMLFWCPPGEEYPPILFWGGGQVVSLTVERVGGSSVVAYTYRGINVGRTFTICKV